MKNVKIAGGATVGIDGAVLLQENVLKSLGIAPGDSLSIRIEDGRFIALERS